MTSPWQSCDLWDKRGEEVQTEETGDKQAEVPANDDVDVEESLCKEGGSGIDGLLSGNIAAVPELVKVVDGNLTVNNEVFNRGEGHEVLDGMVIDEILVDSTNRETEHSEDRDTVDESILPEQSAVPLQIGEMLTAAGVANEVEVDEDITVIEEVIVEGRTSDENKIVGEETAAVFTVR